MDFIYVEHNYYYHAESFLFPMGSRGYVLESLVSKYKTYAGYGESLFVVFFMYFKLSDLHTTLSQRFCYSATTLTCLKFRKISWY